MTTTKSKLGRNDNGLRFIQFLDRVQFANKSLKLKLDGQGVLKRGLLFANFASEETANFPSGPPLNTECSPRGKICSTPLV